MLLNLLLLFCRSRVTAKTLYTNWSDLFQCVEGENHEKAVELLKQAQNSVKLVVRYTPRVLEEMELRFDKQRAARRRQHMQ